MHGSVAFGAACSIFGRTPLQYLATGHDRDRTTGRRKVSHRSLVLDDPVLLTRAEAGADRIRHERAEIGERLGHRFDRVIHSHPPPGPAGTVMDELPPPRPGGGFSGSNGYS